MKEQSRVAPNRISRCPAGWPAVAYAVRFAMIVVAIGVTVSSSAYARVADSASADAPIDAPLVFVRIPVSSDKQADALGATRGFGGIDEDLPVGSHIALLDPLNRGGSTSRVTNLTPGFAAAGHLDLSFDAKRILFVAKRTPNDQPGVWEVNLDGTGLRQVTTETGPTGTAIYLSTIYTIDADEPLYQIAFSASPLEASWTGRPAATRRSIAEPYALFTCRMDGRRVRRITFNPYGASDPYLLSDGRLVFCKTWTPGNNDSDSTSLGSSLFTVNTDGTDVSAFAGVHDSPAHDPTARDAPVWCGKPCETEAGWIVYVESKQRRSILGGSLVAVRRTRSLRTRRLLADESDGLYYSPSGLNSDNLLASFRPNTGQSYGVYVLDADSGVRIRKVLDDPRWHEIDARVVKPRPVPAGRSSVVDGRVNTGFLYCLDAYLSDTQEGRGIRHGRIDRVQVFGATIEPPRDQPTGRYRADDARANDARANDTKAIRASQGSAVPRLAGVQKVTPTLLGEVSVEVDGSFFLEVPAQTPLRLRTLDAEGAVLQQMHSWIWVMPKEGRGCIGCHEDRELTPPNRHALALRRVPKPVGLATHRPLKQDLLEKEGSDPSPTPQPQ